MAININPGTPLRHVATFNSSGTWIAPIGTNLAFVSIGGAGSGGYGTSGSGGGAVGFAGGLNGAYVQVTGGGTHVVTVGAGGSGQSTFNYNSMPAPTSGGTTSFDGRLTATGAGGNAGSRYAAGSIITSAHSGATSLTTINPGATTLISTGTISSQNTGGGAGGAQANASTRYTPRYNNAGNVTSGAGSNGFVHIYI